MNNNIEPHYVSYDFAKFLKSKGFNVFCRQAFYGDVEDEEIENNEPTTTGDDFILGEYDCYAPEHWEVVDWLYKNYGIWVQTTWVKDNTFRCGVIDTDNKTEFIIRTKDEQLYHKTPEEAYSAAFDYIKTKGLI